MPLFAQPAPNPTQTASPNANASQAMQDETIVCVRHGEKAKGGLGQLDAQGADKS